MALLSVLYQRDSRARRNRDTSPCDTIGGFRVPKESGIDPAGLFQADLRTQSNCWRKNGATAKRQDVQDFQELRRAV
jgi:hypothetical protein